MMQGIDNETGAGQVASARLPGQHCRYELATRPLPGGYRRQNGWIEGDEAFLQELLTDAEVTLTRQNGSKLRIELTEVAGSRGWFRVPGIGHTC